MLLLAGGVTSQSIRRRALAIERARVAALPATEDPHQLERAAERAERDGDWELAVRLRFRAGLLRLDRRRVLVYRPSLTTGEVARATGSRSFAEIGDRFDAIVYGGRAGREGGRGGRQARLGGGPDRGGGAMRWLPRSLEGRLALGVVVVVVGFNLVALVVDALVPSPEGPRSSSFATAPEGVAAWADLARESGREVRALRERPSDDTLPSEGTVVVLDPEDFSPGQARALRRFAERGGRVVAGGARPGEWLAALTGEDAVPEWERGGGDTARVLVPAPETGAASSVAVAGDGHWGDANGALPLVQGDDGPIVLVQTAGDGRIALVADASPLHNRLLDEADNAALALALAGPGPVTFVESVHGYGTGTGLAALPARFRWATRAARAQRAAADRRPLAADGPARAAGAAAVPAAPRLRGRARRDAGSQPGPHVGGAVRTLGGARAARPPRRPAARRGRRGVGRRGPRRGADGRGGEGDPGRRGRRRHRGRTGAGPAYVTSPAGRRLRCPRAKQEVMRAELYEAVSAEVEKVVVGQEQMTATALAAVSLGGHVLLEGPPGVAKTLLASALSRALGLDFRRIQFTPDMLPSDVTGNVALRGGELIFRRGPVFTNVLLADEINRTPPKTQAALLEAMQERQVSVEGRPEPLPDPFLVLATQNPIEYEGTYALPEAQLDRFLVRLQVGYPDEAQELRMLGLARRGVGAGRPRPRAAGRRRRTRCAKRAPPSTRRAWTTRSPAT